MREAAPVRSVLARLMGVHTEERAWRLGAQGEELVAAQLARLIRKDPRWRCLHSVPVGGNGADIDHVVMGPGGVFVLNAKHHPKGRIWIGGDTFLLNGVRQPYVRNSRYEAQRAERLLSGACGFGVSVTAVLVPVNARSLAVKSPPSDVYVVNRRRVCRWLRRQPERLDAGKVERIYSAARRASTWR